MNDAERHLRLLTRTTEVVNSSLDLQEVLEAIAHEVAAALETDACFVYLYDERADELVLRATHGAGVEDATSAPRMRSGEGITGVAAAEREPIMIAERAHLDPRFKAFPNLREDQYESILAVPILARDVLEGALNVRTRAPRLHEALQDCAAAIRRGADPAEAVAKARDALASAGFAVDYVEARHAETLEPLASPAGGPVRLLAAARLGRTRLIDNIPV